MVKLIIIRTVAIAKNRLTGLVFSEGRCSLLEKITQEQAVMSGKAKVGSHRRLSTYAMDNMKTSKPESERDSGFSGLHTLNPLTHSPA